MLNWKIALTFSPTGGGNQYISTSVEVRSDTPTPSSAHSPHPSPHLFPQKNAVTGKVLRKAGSTHTHTHPDILCSTTEAQQNQAWYSYSHCILGMKTSLNEKVY
jgi:hypothetical protein